MKEEKLVAKLYDAIIGVGFIIGASIAFGWWGFFIALVVEAISEYSNKHYKLSDWSEH